LVARAIWYEGYQGPVDAHHGGHGNLSHLPPGRTPSSCSYPVPAPGSVGS
jgi:hypothetical protein